MLRYGTAKRKRTVVSSTFSSTIGSPPGRKLPGIDGVSSSLSSLSSYQNR